MIGAILQIAGCILASFKSIMASQFLVGDLKFHPIELSYRMSLYAMIQMLIISVMMGEATEIQGVWPPKVLPLTQSF